MNELITTSEVPTFNLDIIKQSGFVVGKHKSWKYFRNGLVTFAEPRKLTVLFQTGAHASTSYFVVKASEVAAGDWDITYSNDMEEIYHE